MGQVLGALFAVLVGLFILPTFSRYQQIGNENSRELATAQQQQQLCAAAQAYIQQNAGRIMGNASATTPQTITVADLQGAGLLAAGFSATNPYGQTWQVQVLQPSAGNLQALVLSTGGIVPLTNLQASRIAGLVGAAGGFIPFNVSTLYQEGNAYGAYGSWTVATTGYNNAAAGHLAAMVSYSQNQSAGNYLFRNAVANQPQLNQMNTALNMGSNNINNAARIGIGTANPEAELDVRGDAQIQKRATVGYVNNSSPGFLMFTQSDIPIIQGLTSSGGNNQSIGLNPWGGNVGVGTTAPGYTLDISGNFRINSNSSYEFVMNTPEGLYNQIKFQSNDADTWILGNNPGYRFNLWDNRTAREIFEVTSGDDLLLMRTSGNVQVGHDLKVENGTIFSKTHTTDNLIVKASLSGQNPIFTPSLHATTATISHLYVGDGGTDYALFALDAYRNIGVGPGNKTGSAYLNDVYLASIKKYASQLQGVRSGALCGSATFWNGNVIWEDRLISRCQGRLPGYDTCPMGYTGKMVFIVEQSAMWSCVKD